MDDDDTVSEKLRTSCFREMQMDVRYYAFYEKIRHRIGPSHLTKPDILSALKATGVAFRYDSKESFFFTEKSKIGNCEVALKLRFRHDRAELILSLKSPRGSAGGPFTLLARKAGVSRNSEFSPTPPAPKLPFTNRKELAEVIHFSLKLYADMVRALRTSDICTNTE